MKIDIERVGGTNRLWFQEDAELAVWTVNDVTFRSDAMKTAPSSVTMQLVRISSQLSVYAECQLSSDTTHRDVRSGSLVIGDTSHASMFVSLFAGKPNGYVDSDFYVRILYGTEVYNFQRVPVVWRGSPSPEESSSD